MVITYNSAEREKSDADGEEVTSFDEIDRLEGLLVRDSLLLGKLDESVDVFHAGKSRDRLLDLLDGSGLESVGDPGRF